MKIFADRAVCEGHGMCEALAPDVFRVGDDGIVVPLADPVSASGRALIELAVDSCPVQALRLG
ncbi:ferredoxin [Nocardia sp. NBC_01730]|uniref:ferredoxin n=1 Tax=Nocardia sp. NBC_01730 TaxID=2975998 RepID=UPI002E10EA72|nr:ferredoxin [Nocardia sp. NBC_01730]